MQKTLPTKALLYTPLAMFYTGLLIASILLLLKSFIAFGMLVCCLALLLFFIYQQFGYKQSLLTIVVSTLSMAIFFLLAKLAVVFPVAPDWPYQTPYASILNFSWAYMLCYLFWYTLIATAFITVCHRSYRNQNQETLYYFYPFIGMIFVTILLTCNITTQKIARFAGKTVDVGTWFFPFVFIFNNIFTEIYGYASSRIIIWSGLLINILIACLLSVVALIPATQRPLQDAFSLVVGMTFRIVLASMISYFCSEFTNSYVLAKLKIFTRGRWLWIRTISSTAIAMIADSILFTTIAFMGVIPLHLLVIVMLFQYALKLGFEIMFTPLTYAVVMILKRKEKIDYYDIGTRFNPFLVFKINSNKREE